MNLELEVLIRVTDKYKQLPRSQTQVHPLSTRSDYVSRSGVSDSSVTVLRIFSLSLDLRHDLTVYLILLDDRLARAPRSKEIPLLGLRSTCFIALIDNRSSTSSEEAIAVDVNMAGLLVPRDSLGLPTGLPYVSVIEEVANANLITTVAKSVVSAHVDLKFCRDLLELVLVDFALLTKRRNVEIRRALACRGANGRLGSQYSAFCYLGRLYYYGCSIADLVYRPAIIIVISLVATKFD
ncbi:hypothetical protein L209DRAFT_746849 [Thermothelomyces heterothallicus CBS 203.75]